MDENRIDPFRYGVLHQKVDDYQRKLEHMEKKMDKLELQLETLIALANQGRGGFWMGMLIVSAASATAGWVISWINNK